MKDKFNNIYLNTKEFIINNKKGIIIGLLAVVIVFGGTYFMKNLSTPKLSLEVPKEKIIASNRDEIIIPAVLNKLPNNTYPAASVAINFDKNKLEFMGIKIGTMETYDDYDKSKDEEPRFKIPEWVYNIETANQDGVIKAMYLDTTASKNAYSKDGYEKDKKDIPFQLVFKLKDSVIPKDKLEVSISEAVFATVNGDEDKSTLSTKEGYGKLKVEGAQLKIK
ncbi:MAG: hypothetical protein ACRC92_21005 [Peptostreptococcaceae bacterium]